MRNFLLFNPQVYSLITYSKERGSLPDSPGKFVARQSGSAKVGNLPPWRKFPASCKRRKKPSRSRLEIFGLATVKKSISDVYTKVKLEATKRKNWCEQAGLGFAFTRSEEKVVEITKSQGSEAAA
jgi:hypothetical protein